ncbi:MAG: hypothetical protein ACYTEU_04345, partial [Planctomycetota bacterium]
SNHQYQNPLLHRFLLSHKQLKTRDILSTLIRAFCSLLFVLPVVFYALSDTKAMKFNNRI